jgi:hypothetical protein
LQKVHVNVNGYLQHISKRESAECEWRKSKQDVKHVMMEYDFTKVKRREVKKKQKGIVNENVLYTKERVAVAVEIWEQFVKNRMEHRNKAEEEDRGIWWGWGDVHI